MPQFRGIIEDSAYGQHHFNVEADDIEKAEELAIFKVSEEVGDSLENFSILICSEILTQAQADQYEKENGEDPGAE